MAQILIVDDEESIRVLLQRVLESDGHACRTAWNASSAIEALQAGPCELVLCDVNMPGVNGVELARRIVEAHPATAVLMVTAQDDPKIASAAFEIGAYGYMVKPLKKNELRINVEGALRRRRAELENRAHRLRLEQTVQDRTEDLIVAVQQLGEAERGRRASEADTIERLMRAAEFRDNETGQHIERMSRFAALLARRAGWAEERSELLRLASPMHDVGKIGIPDQILQKPGKHTPEEFEVMKTHAEIGYRILSGSRSAVLGVAATIAWTHHEKFDGSGYPRGLAGEQIPVEGRIVAIADVFDALLTKRCYKPAYSLDDSLAIMSAGKARHFDPALLDTFIRSLDEAMEIRERFSDGR